MMLPENLIVALTHCDEPLAYKGGGVTWEGELEITTDRFLCKACGLRVQVRAEEVSPRCSR